MCGGDGVYAPEKETHYNSLEGPSRLQLQHTMRLIERYALE